jgi:D-alanyl-D-alanine carboxypeptidase
VARLALAAVVLLTLAGCGGSSREEERAAPGPRLTAEVAGALDARLQEKVEETGVPGASAAVVFPDGREWTGAAGDAVVKPRQPMSSDTALPLDSITKVATATLALRLVEEDRLALDDPIRKWYPAWRGDPEATVRDLLGHTSGAGDPPDAFWPPVLNHPERPVSARRYVAASGRPGPRTTSAEYSNAGFVIAGLVLERAAGEPVAAAMRRKVFAAEGGDGLALQPAERPAEPHAHSYWYPRSLSRRVDANDGGPLLPSAALATMGWTASSLAGDVPSLARWGDELLRGRILRAASLHEMTRFHPGGIAEAYGLGLARSSVDGRTLLGHIGDGQGSHTELWHLPKERLTVAVTWNDEAIDDDGQILPALVRAALSGGRGSAGG